MWQRGCAWQMGHVWGVCMAGEACMVGGMGGRGHVWQGGMQGGICGGVCVAGGMHGRGACVVAGCVAGGLCGKGGMHGRGCVWQILRDMVNERAVCILLECMYTCFTKTNSSLRFIRVLQKISIRSDCHFSPFPFISFTSRRKKIVKKFHKMDAALFKNWYTLAGLKSCQIVGFCHQLKACPPPPPSLGNPESASVAGHSILAV